MGGIIGGGRELHLTDSSGAFVKIPGLKTATPPNPSVDMVESTNQDSGGIKEYLAGLTEPGEVGFNYEYIPGGVADALVREHLASKQKRPFKITMPNGTGQTEEIIGEIYISEHNTPDGTVGEEQIAEVTCQISGAASQAAG